MSYELNVVRLGHRHDLAALPPAVAACVSATAMEDFAAFPGADDAFPIFFGLVDESGRVCSYFRTIPDQVTVEGRTHAWAWTGDNFTHPDMRGKGLSTRMQREATALLHAMDIGRGSVLSTPVTLHIFGKLGFTLLGYVPRHLLLRDAGPFLDAHVGATWLRPLARIAAWPFVAGGVGSVRAWNAYLARRVPPPVRAEPDDGAFRDLLGRIEAARAVHFDLDPRHVARKMEAAARHGPASLYLLPGREGGAAAGYFIVRERDQDEPLADRYRGFRLMTLMDYGFVSDEAGPREAMVGSLLRVFFGSSCSVLEVIANDAAVNAAARRRGLLPVGKGMSFGYAVPEAWAWPERLRTRDAWPLTRFCGDGYSF